ncbi:sporulation histidine kinase inhibitor Sda [Paenibacillus sp. MBLB4367]
MQVLSNEVLIHVYNQALEQKLDADFIHLLQEEMRKRKLDFRNGGFSKQR